METIKVKPWHESQGDHVVINVEDFDAERHEPLDAKPEGDEQKRRGRPPKAKEQA